MITIGPQRIHHSPFVDPLAAARPRSPAEQPLSSSSKHHHQSRLAASLKTQQSSGTGAMSGRRSHQNGRNGRRSSDGPKASDTGSNNGACPPRFERAVREERRQSGSGVQQQHHRGGGGSGGEPGNREQKSRGLATTPQSRIGDASAAAAPLEKGRESRSSIPEPSVGSMRRQPAPSQRQQQFNTRRWTKGGGSSSGSGPNSPRPPATTTTGGRSNRRRRTPRDQQTGGVSELSNHQSNLNLHLPLTAAPLADSHSDHQQGSKGGEYVAGSTSDGWTRRKRPTAGKCNRGNRPMSSIDSGKGEELSSSCESSVFDPQTPSTILVESLGERSRCSSCTSSLGDDEFHDALSHPPSDDDGVNSSAFVTPSTTPPHSPTPRDLPCLPHPTSTSTSSPLSTNESSLAEKLRHSLELLSEDQQYKSCDQHLKSHDQQQESHDQHKNKVRDRHQTSHDKHPKPRELQQKSHDQSNGSNDSHVTKSSKNRSRKQKKLVNNASSTEIEPSLRVDETRAKSTSSVECSRVNGTSELTEEKVSDGSQRVGHTKGEGGEGRQEERGEGGRKGAGGEGSGEGTAATHGQQSLEECDFPPNSVMMSSVGEGSYSGSDASPQSSVCSNSSHPQTPPICSSPSHSPSPSTPSQRHSPSPSLHVDTETVATDTSITTEMRKQAQEWPILEPISTSDRNEDEWPDLHSPDVKTQPSDPFLTNSVPNEEVRVQHLEPHPQNAAAAYPHMIHPGAPYSHIGWPPHFLHHMSVPVTTTGPFNYYHFHHIQHQTGFTGYYHHPMPPAFAWSETHARLQQQSTVPVPYTHSGSQDDSGCVESNETPSTSQGEEEEEGEYDDGDTRRQEEIVVNGEEDRLMEEKEGEEEEGEKGEEEEGEKGEEEEGEKGEEEEGEKGEEEEGEKGEVEEGEKGEEEEGEKGEEEECVEKEGGKEEEDLDEAGKEGGGGGEVEGGEGEAAMERDVSPDVCPADIVATVPSHHPLESTWVMWYDRISGNTRNCRSDYRSSLKNLHTVSSVEDFWRLYNNIRQPSALERNSNYHFFKEGIEPLWEDPANEQGGKWVLTLKDETILDKIWEELLLAMIGGVIESSQSVNGAVVSRRKKGDRVALWTSQKSNKVNLNICVDLLRVLAIACDVTTETLPDFVHQLADGRGGLSLEYMYHRDSLRSGTSYQNSGHIHLQDNCQSLVAKVLEKLT